MGRRQVLPSCKICGRSIGNRGLNRASYAKQGYCCRECYLSENKHICLNCGKELENKVMQSKFCNKICRCDYLKKKRASKRVKRICQYCGNLFETNQPKAKYCSDKCQRKQHAKQYAGVHRRQLKERKYNTSMVSNYCICKNCKRHYIPIKKDYNTFCSRECSYTYKKERRCKYCKIFKANKDDTYYCKNCAKKMARHRRRAIERNVKAEHVLFANILKRDRGKCQICGIRVHKRFNIQDLKSATIDHIIALSNGGQHTYDNVQLACWGCNSKKRNKKTWVQQLLIA